MIWLKKKEVGIFENLFIWIFWPRIFIQHPKFSLIANFHIPTVFDFVAIIDLRIHRGIDHENRSRFNSTPSVVIHGQVPYKSSNLLPSLIKFGNTKVMKLCSQTNIRVLSGNLGSENSYDSSYRNSESFQNEAAKLTRCLTLVTMAWMSDISCLL